MRPLRSGYQRVLPRLLWAALRPRSHSSCVRSASTDRATSASRKDAKARKTSWTAMDKCLSGPLGRERASASSEACWQMLRTSAHVRPSVAFAHCASACVKNTHDVDCEGDEEAGHTNSLGRRGARRASAFRVHIAGRARAVRRSRVAPPAQAGRTSCSVHACGT